MKASQLPQDLWNTKLNVKKLPKRVKLNKDFAGIKAGSMLFVGTPQIIDDYMCKVPHGETRTIERMRRELARKNQCDATCPVSMAIFMHISAQAAIEKMDQGTAASEVTPFWRVIDASSTIGRKLTIDSQCLTWLRESEQAQV